MRLPGFITDFSSHRLNGYCGLLNRSSCDGEGLTAALEIVQKGPPIDICEVVPDLCEPVPAIKVSWLSCGNASGYVLVNGSNFATQSGVQVVVSNCSEAFPVPAGATTDVHGSFNAFVRCDCGGSTAVRAIDSAGNLAQGSAPMPC
jgi:hypothetical protein